jgi:PPK2 family polyphosphate:nucleotide phosphotransferase
MDAHADHVTDLKVPPKLVRKVLDRYRVTDGKNFKLKHCDPADTAGQVIDRDRANQLLANGVKQLAELQAKLYAQSSWALLCVFQAMDAAGKDGTIKHVFTGVNPQGVQVTGFKAPGPEELAHDFLWRSARALPARGRIGIFNRSYYEEVLVVRVHRELLTHQNLPEALLGRKLWDQRLEAIADFERYLSRQGIVVLKFFLNVSREEQRRRFLSRLEEEDKNWKFSAADARERGFWDQYQQAYEAAIAATATSYAPWFVVPADHKWFTHLVVVAAMIEALMALDLRFPEVDAAQRVTLESARAMLEQED